MRRRSIVLTAAVSVTLVSCAAFRAGNVRGNFVCEAPSGMCAPTTKIDDQALALIAEGEAALTRTPAVNSAAHSPRAMRIVLPARQDRFGRWREPTIVYAEPLDLAPDLAATLTGGGAPASLPAQLGLADLAARAPGLADIDAGKADATKEPAATGDPREGGAAVPLALSRAALEAEVRARLAAKRSAKVPDTAGAAGEVRSAKTVATLKAPAFPAADAKGDN